MHKVSLCRGGGGGGGECIFSSFTDKVISKILIEQYAHLAAYALRYMCINNALLIFSIPLCIHKAEVQRHGERAQHCGEVKILRIAAHKICLYISFCHLTTWIIEMNS